MRVRGHARAADAEAAHHVGEGVYAQVQAGEADVVRARVRIRVRVRNRARVRVNPIPSPNPNLTCRVCSATVAAAAPLVSCHSRASTHESTSAGEMWGDMVEMWGDMVEM